MQNPFESEILEGILWHWHIGHVNIGRCVGEEDNLIRTLVVNPNGKLTPVVLVHGFLSGLCLWIHQLNDLARDRPVYVIDLLGFGSSSRPVFSTDAEEAEGQMVSAIGAWVTMTFRHVNPIRFVLVGHSMGGYLVSAYALRHPEQIAHLILADPWGFLAEEDNVPLWVYIPQYLMGFFNARMASRLPGPLARWMSRRLFGYLAEMFIGAVENPYVTISQYLMCCNSQNSTGETCMTQTIMARGGFQRARIPMANRLEAVTPRPPITFIYGERSWIVKEPGWILMENMIGFNVYVIDDAGHHVYADQKDAFNDFVLSKCEEADHAGVGHP